MNTTQDFVRQTFENDFDRRQFGDFINRLLKSADFREHFAQRGSNVRQAFRDKVSSFERIAQFADVEGNKIDVLIVNLRRDSTIERGRTSLRNFAADYLQSDRGLGKAAVLIAYVSDSKRDWRFSYVTLEKSLVRQESGRFKETITTLTPARRFSFLVGRDEQTHTAQTRFFDLLQSQSAPTLGQIEEAFSIEKVTDEFYKDYEKLFRRLEKEIETLRKANRQLDQHLQENFIENADFSKKLLGQIVFLYFLQKKGWFGVERGAAWGSGNRNFLRYLFKHCAKLGTRQERRAHRDVNFFNDILEHLFYDALARERDDDYYARFDCQIPFLNGGLFDAAYRWSTVDVLLPDSLFSNDELTKDGDKGTGILDVFDRYNFTVNEAEPLEKDVAVDPEMLGKVFENLLPENERKDKGSFYTPRRIVNYMCQQSLISYLTTHLPDVPRADIETFIHVGDFQSAYEAAGTKEYAEKFLPESVRLNAARMDALLEGITVCDPAIGSGAFPVGMMQEIVRARSSLTDALDAAKPNKSQSERERFERARSAYELKRHVIQSSLYGVDIDPGAVEIAKLRLWLSLVVDEDDRERVQALPNLDYKIMQGNALLDEFAGVKLIDDAVFEKPSMDIEAERAAIQQRIRELERQLYALHGKGAEARALKRKFSKETDRLVRQSRELTQPKAADIDSLLPDDPYREARTTLVELKRQIDEFFSLTSPTEKREARARIEELEWRFMEQTLTARGEQDALEELALHRRDNRKPYFLWKLYFSDVFQSKGGFDIVIANPPYVSALEFSTSFPKSLREAMNRSYASAKGTYDLYVLFIELGIRLLNQNGSVVFINPNKFLSAKYGVGLRQFILDNAHVQRVVDVSGINIFESAAVYPVLIFLRSALNRDGTNETELLLPVKRQLDEFDPAKYRVSQVGRDKLTSLPENIWGFLLSNQLELLSKLMKGCVPFSELGEINATTTAAEAAEYGQFIEERKERDSLKVINTGTIDPYLSLWGRVPMTNAGKRFLHPYLSLSRAEVTQRRRRMYQGPKVIFAKMAKDCEAYPDFAGEYASLNTNCFYDPVEGVSLHYVTAVCNSKVFMFFYNQFFGALRMSGGYYQFQAPQLRVIPFKKIPAPDQTLFVTLVEYVCFLKQNVETSTSLDRHMISYFEQLLDALVYERYLPDELPAADRRFFKPLAAERLPSLAQHEGDELRLIRRLFTRLSDENHPVRRNLYFLENLESVRIIEGR